MEVDKQQIVRNIVQDIADLLGVHEDEKIMAEINRLQSMEIVDAVDSLLISLAGRINLNQIKKADALKVAKKHITKLMPEKYPTISDLIKRLESIKIMNLDNAKMSLKANHKELLTIFDNINILLGSKFDYYHTGGIMGYIASNIPLQRYHEDLDIFFNENQLFELKKLIDDNPDFKLISNMKQKGDNGHEFSIKYKNSPIEIGLFLFARGEKNELILKNYYYDENKNLIVVETSLSEKYSALVFPKNNIKSHNNIPYSMQSLEAIYLSKKNANRMKDKQDISVLERKVDIKIVNKIKKENKKTIKGKGTCANNTIVFNFNKEIED